MPVSTAKPSTVPSDNGTPAKAAAAAVIRRVGGAEESAAERLVTRHLPAWVVSGLVHLGIIALAWLVFGFAPAPVKTQEKILDATVEKEAEEPVKDLTNEDPGFDSTIESALPDIERLAEKTADAIVSEDPVGVPDAKTSDNLASQISGLSVDAAPGLTGELGNTMSGDKGGSTSAGAMNTAFLGRSGGTKSRMLKEGGGNEASELAVARALAWLARQQKPNGSWVFDGGSKDETVAATGMALLPFLAAGQTQRTGKYAANVGRGLAFLGKSLTNGGKFNNGGMYAHGIAATALCEAYGMTKDPSLKPSAQAAINYIVTGQAEDGSWGYTAPAAGDTSIVGWQVQALKAAKLSKDIVVPDKTIKRAISFLDKVSVGSRKSAYGYAAPAGGPGTSLTAVGLLCRYYISEWGPNNAGMAEGVDGLMKAGPKKKGLDMYYYYYATQVVHFFGDDQWKEWNEGPRDKEGKRAGGMRDWLIDLQKKDATPFAGSWEPDVSHIGTSCGRLGTTCLALLTLEVYYRHLPLYKRDTGGAAALEMVK